MRDIRKLVAAKAGGLDIGKDVATLADQMDDIWFACPVCGDIFPTKKKAEKCRDQPYDDGGLTVGTIVVVPGKWTNWYGPTDPWVAFTIPADPSNEDHLCHYPQRVPYYVVTAIHGDGKRDPHRCVVTLSSLVNGTLNVGWNPANGEDHYAMFRLDGGKHCDPWDEWEEEIGCYLDCVVPAQVIEEAARLARLGISTENLL